MVSELIQSQQQNQHILFDRNHRSVGRLLEVHFLTLAWTELNFGDVIKYIQNTQNMLHTGTELTLNQNTLSTNFKSHIKRGKSVLLLTLSIRYRPRPVHLLLSLVDFRSCRGEFHPSEFVTLSSFFWRPSLYEYQRSSNSHSLHMWCCKHS